MRSLFIAILFHHHRFHPKICIGPLIVKLMMKKCAITVRPADLSFELRDFGRKNESNFLRQMDRIEEEKQKKAERREMKMVQRAALASQGYSVQESGIPVDIPMTPAVCKHNGSSQRKSQYHAID